MKNNKFYVCDKYLLALYQTKEDAMKISSKARGSVCDENLEKYKASPMGFRPHIIANFENWVDRTIDYWKKSIEVDIQFTKPGELIFLITKESVYCNVIVGEKSGWIIAKNWLNFKEVISE